MDTLIRDVRSGLRGLLRAPGHAAAVLAILSLGIAANTVVFSVVDALVLDPFPYPEANRLVLVGTEVPAQGRSLGYFERLSGPEIVDLTERSRTLERALPFDLNSVRLRGPDFPVRLFGGFFWGDPFRTLGVEPALGRGFNQEEIARGDRVMVISQKVWAEHFGSSPSVIGRTVVADGDPYTVIGVMPPFTSVYGTDVWVPKPEPAATLARDRRQFNVLARVAPGQSLEQVNAELAIVAAAIEAEHGAEFDEYRGWRLQAARFSEVNASFYRDEALLTLGAVSFVLLLVCANLGNLMLARATGRRGEIAIRMALGAGRWRVLRQVLTESLTIAAIGAAIGLLLALWGMGLVGAMLPGSMQPDGRELALDGRAILYTAAIAAMAALLFGAAPAIQLSRARIRDVLSSSTGRSTGGRRTQRTQSLFTGAQVALAIVLLSGAAILIGGMVRLLQVDLGFDTEGLISMRLSLPAAVYEGEAVAGFFDELASEVGALPGADAVSVATQVAPSTFFGGQLVVEAREEDGADGVRSYHTVVGDDYFAALGLELVAGRPIDGRDRADTPPVLVVNQLAAERFFGGEAPLGQRARIVTPTFDSGWAEVVGVVSSVHNLGLTDDPQPEVYTSHRQAPGRWRQMFLVARAEGDPFALVPQIRDVVARIDPDQPLYSIGTAAQALEGSVAPRRVAAAVVSGLAAIALVLAAIGIYAVITFGIAMRAREIGIRMAVGAPGARIVRMVLRQAIGAVAAGAVVGGLAALLLARWLAERFEAALALQVGAVILTAAVLAVVALIAAALPARRASRLDPVLALRQE
jgi:putative ABC transport system permease protein